MPSEIGQVRRSVGKQIAGVLASGCGRNEQSSALGVQAPALEVDLTLQVAKLAQHRGRSRFQALASWFQGSFRALTGNETALQLIAVLGTTWNLPAPPLAALVVEVAGWRCSQDLNSSVSKEGTALGRESQL